MDSASAGIALEAGPDLDDLTNSVGAPLAGNNAFGGDPKAGAPTFGSGGPSTPFQSLRSWGTQTPCRYAEVRSMSVSVRYVVDDVDVAVDFYRDLLGFGVDMQPAPGFAAISNGDLRLLLNAPGAGGAGTAGGNPEPGGWNRIQLEVDDLDAEIDRLASAGTTFRGDPVEGRGGRQVLVEDPSGNPVELFEVRRT